MTTMMIKFRDTNGVYGTISIDDKLTVNSYELYVPEDVVLLPIRLTPTNIPDITILLKKHGWNSYPTNVMNVELTMEEPPISTNRYQLVNLLLQHNLPSLDH